MGLKTAYTDKRLNVTIPDVYYVAAGIDGVDFETGDCIPLFSAYVTREQKIARKEHIHYRVPAGQLFGSPSAMPFGANTVCKVDFTKDVKKQIYDWVKTIPGAPVFVDVLEDGQTK